MKNSVCNLCLVHIYYFLCYYSNSFHSSWIEFWNKLFTAVRVLRSQLQLPLRTQTCATSDWYAETGYNPSCEFIVQPSSHSTICNWNMAISVLNYGRETKFFRNREVKPFWTSLLITWATGAGQLEQITTPHSAWNSPRLSSPARMSVCTLLCTTF